MPGYYDIYVASTKRNRDTIDRFLARYLPNRTESRDEYEFPQNSEEPDSVFQAADEVIEKCIEDKSSEYNVYWRSRSQQDVMHANIHFLSDGNIIYGLATDREDFSLQDELLDGLKSFLGSDLGCITFESPPSAETYREFEKQVHSIPKYGPVRFEFESCNVEIKDDPTFSLGSADNVHNYDIEYSLGNSQEITSRHSINVVREAKRFKSCILMSDAGPTSIHSYSAVRVLDQCVIAVGNRLVSLRLPSLQLDWAIEVDDVSCFGVHFLPEYECLVSHGEMVLSRLSLEGKIEWIFHGGDIFTEGMWIDGEFVVARDFRGNKYKINVETGANKI